MAATTVAPPRTRRSAAGIILRVLIALVILIVLLAASAAIWFYWRAHAALPQLDGIAVLDQGVGRTSDVPTIEEPDLQAEVEVLRDAQGVPHVRGQSLDDLMFAQGYVTAQDRLWQMDLSRRLAAGELSEVFGERTLPADIENRKLGFRQAAERGRQELDAESRRVVNAYAQGVNAFISTHQDRLPIEFTLLHYKPRPWSPADSVGVGLNMAKNLNTSWRTDVMRERVRSLVAPQLYADLFPDRSPLDHPVAEPVKVAAVPGRIDNCRLSIADCPKPSMARGPSSSAATDNGPLFQPTIVNRQSSILLDPTLAVLVSAEEDSDFTPGSNNWVVSGAHTASGKPLLANDPHLGHSIPSVWTMVELEAPGLHVAGVTLPGWPLVIIGHNERIAWGMTNTSPDVQDVYREDFNPSDGTQYRHNGQWEKAELREETIKVRGRPDYRLVVKVTRHGPIIAASGNQGLALQWTALQPHALTFPFLDMARARNWKEFTDAIRHFTGPEQNMVYADVDDNIGYYAPAWVPIRKQGDGSLPQSGATDDFDWTGYIPFEDLPHAFNPPSGIIATANSRVVPDGYPYFISHDWAAPYRTARIFQLLEAAPPRSLTVDDMLRIQMDIHSIEDEQLAKKLVGAAAAHPPETDDARYALGLLQKWDGEARMDSAATLVCEVTRPVLLARLLNPKLGDGTSDLAGYRWGTSATFVDNVLSSNWTRWLPPGDADFNATLVKSLEEGVRKIPAIVASADRKACVWGNTIPLTFHHPLDVLPFMQRLLDVGPFPQMGMNTTVKATTTGHGPSMRLVADLADLDHSVNNITLGESGQVFSPYYKDQFQAWYTGHSFAMLFSDAVVEKGAVHKLVLEPSY
ncbi:MAG TPA: penicillin acylase family protein [Terriglobia bacterium]|nr:penicillin acylase family protein [Terriglobia bacterium]